MPADAPLDRAGRARASLSGWGAALLIGPHVVIGTYLVAVPDRFAFLTSQIVTLVHVAVALVTLPLALLWGAVHARSMGERRGRGQRASKAVQWLLTGAALLACLTGVYVLESGNGTPEGAAHAVTGLAVVVPLAWHLWRARRRRSAAAFALLVPGALLGGLIVRKVVPPEPEAPAVPPFAFEPRSASLYDPAPWCGGCHAENYDEWRRSTHGRTLELPAVRHEFALHADLLPVNVVDLGAMAEGRTPAHPAPQSRLAERAAEGCLQCHAPASFYSDDAGKSLDAPSSNVADAIGCSFCHTLREVRVGHEGPLSGVDRASLVRAASYPVTAPETVRRYLGQASASPMLRYVGDMLIRWRPEMHRRDYHSPVLDTARACRSCHGGPGDDPRLPHRTFTEWSRSPYARHEGGAVLCQDCHMTASMTGERVQSPGRLVPWGPERPQRRSHLFLGGNAEAQRSLREPEVAGLQHAINQKAASLRVEPSRAGAGAVRVRVVVKNELTGHLFPGVETGVRWAWLAVAVLDAEGKPIARTLRPGEGGEGVASPILDRRTDDATHDIVLDTAVAPGSERAFDVELPIAAGAEPAAVTAELFHRLDPEPIARARGPLPPPR